MSTATTSMILRKRPLISVDIPTDVYNLILNAIPADHTLKLGKTYNISQETREWRSENMRKNRKTLSKPAI